MKIQLTPNVIELYKDSLVSIDSKIKFVYYCEGIKAGLVLASHPLDKAEQFIKNMMETLVQYKTEVEFN